MSWDVSGLWDEDRQKLENTLDDKYDDADKYLAQIEKYEAAEDNLGDKADDAYNNAYEYYEKADEYENVAFEYYDIAYSFYDLADEYYSYEMWSKGDQCYAYGVHYESIGDRYEDRAALCYELGAEYEALGDYYQDEMADIEDWIDGLYDSYNNVLDDAEKIESCLQDEPSIEDQIEMLWGDGQIIWV